MILQPLAEAKGEEASFTPSLLHFMTSLHPAYSCIYMDRESEDLSMFVAFYMLWFWGFLSSGQTFM